MPEFTREQMGEYKKWILYAGRKLYKSRWREYGDDIISSGWVGLLRSLENWDPTKGCSQFSWAIMNIMTVMSTDFKHGFIDNHGLLGLKYNKDKGDKKKIPIEFTSSQYGDTEANGTFSPSASSSFTQINSELVVDSILKFLRGKDREMIMDLYGLKNRKALTYKQLSAKYKTNSYRRITFILNRLRPILESRKSCLGLSSAERLVSCKSKR